MTLKKRFELLEKNLNSIIEKREIEKLGGKLFYNSDTKRTEIIYMIFSNKLTKEQKNNAEKLKMLSQKYGYHFEFIFFKDDIPEND